MWLMLQQATPDDYVIATGESHSVREFLEVAAAHLGLDWEKYVEIDPRYFRPTEVDFLQGDATKARTKLGWKPAVTFQELTTMMVEHDLEARPAGADPARGRPSAEHPRRVHRLKESAWRKRVAFLWQATAGWSARRSFAGCKPTASASLLLRTHAELDLTDRAAVDAVLCRRAS